MTGCKLRFANRGMEQAMVEGAKHSLLVTFNDIPKDQAASIELPPRHKKATDLDSKANRPIVNSALQLTVRYQDAVVRRVE